MPGSSLSGFSPTRQKYVMCSYYFGINNPRRVGWGGRTEERDSCGRALPRGVKGEQLMAALKSCLESLTRRLTLVLIYLLLQFVPQYHVAMT